LRAGSISLNVHRNDTCDAACRPCPGHARRHQARWTNVAPLPQETPRRHGCACSSDRHLTRSSDRHRLAALTDIDCIGETRGGWASAATTGRAPDRGRRRGEDSEAGLRHVRTASSTAAKSEEVIWDLPPPQPVPPTAPAPSPHPYTHVGSPCSCCSSSCSGSRRARRWSVIPCASPHLTVLLQPPRISDRFPCGSSGSGDIRPAVRADGRSTRPHAPRR
jgi:hypothetical protein